MKAKQYIYFIILLFFTVQTEAQICLHDIDFKRIEQEKVQEFVINQQAHGIETFDEIKPSLQPDADLKGYFIRENEYQVKKSLDEVWHHYLTTNPEKLWSGKRVSFGFLFSKKDEKIFYCDENFSKIDTGVVVYVNLRLMSGLKNLATAFEITSVDEESKTIEFSYLKGNVSMGKQRIQFYETAKGYTRILHTSYYRNNNVLRNYLLYPYFHTRTTHEFHRNNKRQILAGN
ncbi:MAG TPA: hypothetical protein PLC80_13980 [Draconibacterium sp.]|nr:hypothetical protein [Draconibacterium sp.]